MHISGWRWFRDFFFLSKTMWDSAASKYSEMRTAAAAAFRCLSQLGGYSVQTGVVWGAVRGIRLDTDVAKCKKEEKTRKRIEKSLWCCPLTAGGEKTKQKRSVKTRNETGEGKSPKAVRSWQINSNGKMRLISFQIDLEFGRVVLWTTCSLSVCSWPKVNQWLCRGFAMFFF